MDVKSLSGKKLKLHDLKKKSSQVASFEGPNGIQLKLFKETTPASSTNIQTIVKGKNGYTLGPAVKNSLYIQKDFTSLLGKSDVPIETRLESLPVCVVHHTVLVLC